MIPSSSDGGRNSNSGVDSGSSSRINMGGERSAIADMHAVIEY